MFESTDVATIFLGSNLTIRSFSPTVKSIFNIIASDRGRPITDLSGSLRLPNLAEDIKSVIDGKPLVERQITSEGNEAHYLMRLSPYRDSDKRSDGVVLAFVDITSVTRAEDRQRTLLLEQRDRTTKILAEIRSIAQQTLKGSRGLGELLRRIALLEDGRPS